LINYKDIFVTALSQTPFEYKEKPEDLYLREAMCNVFKSLNDDFLNKIFNKALKETEDFVNFSFLFHRLLMENKTDSCIVAAGNLYYIQTKALMRTMKFIFFLYSNNDYLVIPLEEVKDYEELISLYFYDFEDNFEE